ncbi:MAG: septum formation initiator family protein [Polyangiaceae bacterium]|nr:septum formation initiator family protein [Polyangiaceae bacterium]
MARTLERYLPALVLVTAALGAPYLIFSSEGLPRLRTLDAELHKVSAENDEQRRQITFLRGEVQRLKDDPTAVERIARDELGLVRKSEVVFQFPEKAGAAR